MKVQLGDPLDQSVSPSSACFAALPGNDIIFVCGFWDNSFRCFETETGKWLAVMADNTLKSIRVQLIPGSCAVCV